MPILSVIIVSVIQHLMITTIFDLLSRRHDLARVPPIENDATGEHQGRIKHVDESLLALQISTTSLDVLGNPIDRPDHNQNTDRIQNLHILVPRNFSDHHVMHRRRQHATVKDDRNDDEEPEEDDLDK
ncbi:unnamed protein product [Aspergillus oryzae]|nr:unnamed protein product [Aspergillus oryzae]